MRVQGEKMMPSFGEILPHIEYREREAVYGIVMNESNQIALIRTPRGYFLPGGGIESGEEHVPCLAREFIEETGFSVVVEGYLTSACLYGLTPRQNTYLKMVGHFYQVQMTEKVSVPIEEDHELVWHHAHETPQLLKLEHQAWAVTCFLESQNRK